MATSTADNISGVIAVIIGLVTWPIQLFLLLNGVGSHLSGADFLGWIFCLAPLPLAFRLLANETRDSNLLGIWLIALTPILSTIALFLAVSVFIGAGQKHEMIISISYILLWLLPVFLKKPSTIQAKEQNPKNAQLNFGRGKGASPSVVGVTPLVSGRKPNGGKFDETMSRAIKTEHRQEHAFTAESLPILEATDIRNNMLSASGEQVSLAHANQAEMNRFFSAIHWGRTEEVREALSANPLLVLARDPYGHTPLGVAEKEGHKELQNFLSACLHDS